MLLRPGIINPFLCRIIPNLIVMFLALLSRRKGQFENVYLWTCASRLKTSSQLRICQCEFGCSLALGNVDKSLCILLGSGSYSDCVDLTLLPVPLLRA